MQNYILVESYHDCTVARIMTKGRHLDYKVKHDVFGDYISHEVSRKASSFSVFSPEFTNIIKEYSRENNIETIIFRL